MNERELREQYEAGQRIFRFADLSGAILSGADLIGADLSGADLSGTNLSWTDLSGADLCGGNLCGADLCGANLQHNETIISACLGDYQMHMHIGPDTTPMIHAGCRYFTVPEAKKHWAKGNQESWTEKTEAYGGRQRRMLKFLVAEAKERGWL